jgi:hypothetical protein
MLRSGRLPVKLVVFVVVMCALVAWGVLISSGETVLAQNQPPSKGSTQPAPPTPTPSAQASPPRPGGDGTLMNAGGLSEGPVPKMPGGRCPTEFSIEKDGGCYVAQ